MSKLLLLLLFTIQGVFGNTPYWSKTGHRVIGEVAQEHLNARTQKALKKLLDGQSLASISNFADEIKADSVYRKFDAWHYVNIPANKKYSDVIPNRYGDLVKGIEQSIEIVRNKNSTQAERIFYLKMLVHFVGDLHQPMHVGRLEDKGGNDIQVQWFNRGSNLHKIWDANMIDDYGMSYTELANNLPQWTNEKVKTMQEGTVIEWVGESQEMANRIYGSVEVGEKLYYRYSYVWWDTMEHQLQKGGVRLAKVLNDLFS